MHVLVFAGGDSHDLPESTAALGSWDMVVCADGGVHNAQRLGLQPDLIIGDLDSLGAGEQQRLQQAGIVVDVHPIAKDETDLELALLWCARRQVSKVTLLGALGGRPDHMLANLLLLSDRRLKAIEICLRSRSWQAWIVRHDLTIAGSPGDTVSLIPLSARVTGVHTDALEYPLRGETLYRGPARGVSNVMLGAQARVTFDVGVLAVMHGPAPV
jgi:thiamine pyrophosphokinase